MMAHGKSLLDCSVSHCLSLDREIKAHHDQRRETDFRAHTTKRRRDIHASSSEKIFAPFLARTSILALSFAATSKVRNIIFRGTWYQACTRHKNGTIRPQPPAHEPTVNVPEYVARTRVAGWRKNGGSASFSA